MFSIALIAAGLAVCGWSRQALAENPELEQPTNPFGINRSPYGEVFAMALQGPISTNFHLGVFGTQHDHSAGGTSSHDAADQDCSHGGCDHESHPPKSQPSAAPTTLNEKAHALISSMKHGHAERTNPRPTGATLKYFLRQEAEKKLRFAHRLDPSNYANYNALNLFLTESIGSQTPSASEALQLARETIDYCLKQEDDPRPALTAAAACTNILQLMFRSAHHDSAVTDTRAMRQVLTLLDQCLARYRKIARQWDESGAWSRLSPNRIEECQQRHHFTTRIRQTTLETIQRIEARAVN